MRFLYLVCFLTMVSFNNAHASKCDNQVARFIQNEGLVYEGQYMNGPTLSPNSYTILHAREIWNKSNQVVSVYTAKRIRNGILLRVAYLVDPVHCTILDRQTGYHGFIR